MEIPPFEMSRLGERLYAGRAPLARGDVERLRAHGIARVLDLREATEWSAPGMIGGEAIAALDELGIGRRHLPIPDTAAPSAAALDEAQDFLSRAVVFARRSATEPPAGATYVHCRGGRERTAAVLVAHLAWERGLAPDEALAELQRGRPSLQPLPEQRRAVAAWLRDTRPDRAPTYPSRVRGCLLGGAVGDALGAPIEFQSLAAIRRCHGAAGVRGYEESHGQRGAITDDTQMTLFTAEGIVRMSVRGRSRGMAPSSTVLLHAYQRWLATQGVDVAPGSEAAAGESVLDGWLVQVQGLHTRRAPGTTCLESLCSGRYGLPERPFNNSKGCGGVMRVAPVGLHAWPGLGDQETFRLGVESAAFTHGHPSGHLTAGALALIVRRLCAGDTLAEAVGAALSAVRGWEEPEAAGETIRAIESAVELAAQGSPSPEKVERLGQGWVAEEALAIGLYAALAGETFEPAVLLAVNHSGDSDSTGSLCGQILGARDGVFAIPPLLLRELELRETIARLADDLVLEMTDPPFAENGMGEPPEDWWRRYPGW